MNEKELVSIILPSYNVSDYISTAIDSCLEQTYKNWELIIVDDCSTDNTVSVIKEYLLKDSRIRFFRLDKNSGSAVARSKAIELAKGRYIAFLDADDMWFKEKLEKQIEFMQKNDYSFTCTKCVKMDIEGNVLDDDIKVYDVYDYNKILKRCPSNITVMYDAGKLGKYKVPDIKRRTDYVLWLKIIKDAKFMYALQQPLAAYRIRKGSLSNKKIRLIFYHWHIYRKLEKISVIKSIYLILYIIIRKITEG